MKKFKIEDIDEAIPKQEEKKVIESRENYLPIYGLPSKNKFYSNVLARPLNVKEVKLLASMNEDNYDYVINDILRKTIKGIKVEDITRGDKYFIIFWLRANTYKNSGYELDFVCRSEKCGEKKSSYNFGLELLDVEYIKDNFDELKEIEFPVSKDKFSVLCKRISDENKVNEFLRMTEKNITKYDEEILDIASNIKKINDEELSLMKKYDYVEKMHPEDFSFLISYIDSVSFGVKNRVNAICNDCKEVTPIGVSFRPEFFIPKHKL